MNRPLACPHCRLSQQDIVVALSPEKKRHWTNLADYYVHTTGIWSWDGQRYLLNNRPTLSAIPFCSHCGEDLDITHDELVATDSDGTWDPGPGMLARFAL